MFSQLKLRNGGGDDSVGGGDGEWCCLKFSLVSYSWDIVSEAALLE